MAKKFSERTAAKTVKGSSLARSAESRRMRGMSKIPTPQRRDAAVREIIRGAK
jgi:hypothetical protein